MDKFRVLLFLLSIGLAPSVLAGGTAATLYKNPRCGCCENYAKYLRAHGFDVTVIPTHDLTLMQKENGVPAHLAGCHTTKIGPYVVEGHVPVESVKRLLREGRFIKGIAVPGMPPGSPGMSGAKKEPLAVYVLSNDEPPKVYATH